METFDRDTQVAFESLDLAEWGVPGAPPRDLGDTVELPPTVAEPREPTPRRAYAPVRTQNGLPWSVLLVAMGTLVVLTFLQLAAMTMGASQGTPVAYVMSAALIFVSIAPLVAGRLWWERNRDT